MIRAFLAMAAIAGLAAPLAADEAPGGEPVAKAAECIAEAVYFEARDTGPRAQEAVAQVVVNRAEDPEFPDTACEVVADRCQFSYQCDGKPETMTDPQDRAQAEAVADDVLSGEAPDPTGDALYFHGSGLRPDWTEDLERTREIGGHVFYR